MKPDKVLCRMLLALTRHKTVCLLRTEELINRNDGVGYVIHALCMSVKQKIVQGRGPSNINLAILVCPFDVLRAS